MLRLCFRIDQYTQIIPNGIKKDKKTQFNTRMIIVIIYLHIWAIYKNKGACTLVYRIDKIKSVSCDHLIVFFTHFQFKIWYWYCCCNIYLPFLANRSIMLYDRSLPTKVGGLNLTREYHQLFFFEVISFRQKSNAWAP